MDRRKFAASLTCAALLGTQAGAGEVAKDGSNRFPDFAEIFLEVAKTVRKAGKLFIRMPDKVVELPINNTYPVDNETRVSLLTHA